MIMLGIELPACPFHAMGCNPRTRRLICVKRPRTEIVKAQKYRHDDHTHPSNDKSQALHQFLGYDERIQNLATVN
jgi:hypothetical protein